MNRRMGTRTRTALNLPLLALIALVLVACPATPVNHAPEAHDQTITTSEDTAVVITLDVTDEDDDPLTCTITVAPEHGTLTGTPPDLTYTPDANYAGSDAFTYTTSDGALTSEEATVTITITPSNDVPVANDQTVSTAEDTPIAITLTASDPDGDDLTFAIASEPSQGELTGTPPDLTYTPDEDFTGSDQFTFTATDGTLTSSEATITIDVGSVNDPPTAHDQGISTPEDTLVAITLTASDPDGDELTYAITSDPNHGELTGTAPNVTYTPDADYAGLDTFTFTASDATLTSAPATVTIDVGGTNDAPTGLTLDHTTIPENATPPADVGVLTTTDPDPGNTHTYTLTPGPGDNDNDDFTITGATLQTARAFDHESTPTKTIRIRTTDPFGAYYEATFTITVDNVNEFPTRITLTPDTIPENQPGGTLVGTLTTNDPDTSDTHTYTLTTGDGDDDNQRFTISGNKLRTAEPLDHEATPILSIRVLSRDQGGLGIAQAITVTVEEANHAPVISPPSDQEVIQNFVSPRSLHLTFGAVDDDGDALTVSATSDNHDVVADAGLHLLCDAGECELGFTCARTDAQTATITIEASDGTDTSTATFEVRIAPRLVTTTSDDGSGSLRQVVDDAVQGDVITFDTQGSFATPQTIVLTTGQIRIETPLLVQGPGRDMLTISAGDASRVFRIGTDNSLRFYHQAVIRDITVSSGNGHPQEASEPSAYGGAIQIADRALIERVTIRNSSADEGGGVGAYIRFPLARDPLGTLVVLRDCVVEDNATLYGGGGVYVRLEGRAQASALIEDSIIRGNRASQSEFGGGLQIDEGSLDLVGTTIEDNEGRGVYHWGDDLHIDGSIIRGNTSGGIYSWTYAESHEALMTGTSVTGNTAGGSAGGALEVYGGEFVIDGGTIEGNSAAAGAGINVNGGTVTLRNGATVRDNAAEHGGGGALVGLGALHVQDATISENSADSGGGIYIGMGTVVLEPATRITQNTALTDGGGIYNRDGTLEGATAGGNVYDNYPNDIAP